MKDRPRARPWLRLLPAAMLLALLLHAVLLAAGFERLSNDDAVRVLLALDLAEGSLDAWVWPPLHKMLMAAALGLHPDPVWTPRVLSVLLSLVLLAAVLALAARVTRDRRVLLVAALLAAVTPHRLLLGTAPMADILMLALMVWGAERLLAWLQEGGDGRLLAACALFGAATAVRYEPWFVAAWLGLVLAWWWWRRGRPGFGALAAAGVLIAAFPAWWVAESWLFYGSLDNLATTPRMFLAIAGEDAVRQAVRLNPLGLPLLQELAWNPATPLGIAALVVLARRDAALRRFALAFFPSLLLLGVVMVATVSVSLAATWRMVGFWSLLLLPFGALALVRLAEWAAARIGQRRGLALAALLLPALALPGLRDLRIVRSANFNWETGSPRHDAAAGRAAVAELRRLGGGLALVDSAGNLDFLDVMVHSGRPRLFVTTADAPAPAVALHVPMRGALHGSAEAARYLADRFTLASGGDPALLAARGIRVALVREPALRRALDASPLAERVAAWPDWTLYRLHPGRMAATR